MPHETPPQQQQLTIFRLATELPFEPRGVMQQQQQQQQQQRRARVDCESGSDNDCCAEREGRFACESDAAGNHPLVRAGGRDRAPSRRRRPRDKYTAILVCAAVSLWIMVVIALGVMCWAFVSGIDEARSSAMPYIELMMDHTLNILESVEHSAMSAGVTVDGMRSVSDAAVPAMASALNQTSAIIARLENLARHPVLQLSLAQATGQSP